MMNLKFVLEALIFAFGKPVEKIRLAKICGVKLDVLDQALNELNDEYRRGGRGIRLILKSDSVQMATASEFAESVKSLMTWELQESLSKVSLETLALVAYRGPISRAEIESVRGVNCMYTLRNLAIRGLVERKQNHKDSRVALYEVSMDCLKHLGVEKLTDLPNYSELNNKFRMTNDE